MEKVDFIEEVNRSFKGANLNDANLGYDYKETIPVTPGPVSAKATVTFNGKTKVYQAGHGTTFPYEFVEDLLRGEFAA